MAQAYVASYFVEIEQFLRTVHFFLSIYLVKLCFYCMQYYLLLIYLFIID